MNIIITGAGKGIGFEVVKLFAKNKEDTVIAISRTIDNLQSISKSISTVIPIQFDLANFNNYQSDLLSEIKKHFTKIDILINNAGFLVNQPFQNITSAHFNQTFDINIKSPFFLCQTLLPLMHSETHIVNISSMGGFQGSAKFNGLSVYSASKGALTILTECMAEELKENGIKVNCLALGAVQTEMLLEAFPGYEAPLKPSEMAEFIVDFAINGSKYFNGKIIPVSINTP
jgi:NAD(P)-dependent dehydrogenase (short-subunit alcohol dehydrogenase family)